MIVNSGSVSVSDIVPAICRRVGRTGESVRFNLLTWADKEAESSEAMVAFREAVYASCSSIERSSVRWQFYGLQDLDMLSIASCPI